ncbi:MAG: hypothetical protein JWN60_197 [Acidobacteria bacterium]|jgi:SET domain-containing protein|nr:hypothetical protein [Acidobacteriota bacterium]
MLLVKTKLGVSCIEGIGLFAAEFIKKGTILWRYNSLIDLRLTAREIGELDDCCREQIKKYTYREKDSNLYVLCGDDARFFNHSDEPNCLDVCDGGENDVTIASRNINQGEELTCNYALFDMDLIEGFYRF